MFRVTFNVVTEKVTFTLAACPSVTWKVSSDMHHVKQLVAQQIRILRVFPTVRHVYKILRGVITFKGNCTAKWRMHHWLELDRLNGSGFREEITSCLLKLLSFDFKIAKCTATFLIVVWKCYCIYIDSKCREVYKHKLLISVRTGQCFGEIFQAS